MTAGPKSLSMLVVDEVLTTEAAYVSDLELMQQYMPVVSRALQDLQIENTVNCLVQVHKELLSRLQHAGTLPSAVADAVVPLYPYLRMYALFCTEHTVVIQRLRALREFEPRLAQVEEQHGTSDAPSAALPLPLWPHSPRCCCRPVPGDAANKARPALVQVSTLL